jgi:hypothetical protein
VCKYLIFSLLILSASALYAVDDDEAFLTESLKIEANHNLNRLKAFRSEVDNNKIYEDEREKGLAEFLEDQEKWDLVRERGLKEYRAQKKDSSPSENTAEYEEYQRQKAVEDQKYEKARRIQVTTREKVQAASQESIAQLEANEQELNSPRPRYDLRQRGHNKWVASGKSGVGGGSAYAPSVGSPVPPPNDFPAVTDFPPAPAPYEGYEEFPIPPVDPTGSPYPQPTYDPSFGADSGGVAVPPPPPPPPDFDF